MEGEAHDDTKRRQEITRGRGARPAIDWDAAFVYYGSLSSADRSYAAVAAEFGVSVRTVESHGRKEKWKQRVQTISMETRARTADSLVDARVAEVEEMRRLIDASLVGYAEALRNGMRMAPADLERLNRLSLALTEELLGPRSLGNEEEAERYERTPEHVRGVIDTLAEAGILEAIGLTRLEPASTDSVNEREDEHHELV